MMKALITRKVGMTTIIGSDGTLTPITILSAVNNQVIGKRTVEKDSYSALIIGAEKAKKLSKPLAGSYKEIKEMPSVIREFRIDENNDQTNVGDVLKADIFNVGDTVDVTANSKGKGWAGTIKRHGFHRGRKTNGGRSYRRVGSIGSMYPQHILKGKKMPGRMGASKVTTKGLKIAYIDSESNSIGVKGAVPGPKKGLVILREAK